MRKKIGTAMYQWRSSRGSLSPVILTLFRDGPAFLLTIDDGGEYVDRKIHFVSADELVRPLPDRAYD
jgi:hypothetical protein